MRDRVSSSRETPEARGAVEDGNEAEGRRAREADPAVEVVLGRHRKESEAEGSVGRDHAGHCAAA